ncbi:MAG: DUF1572 family protein [Aurantibacter sp.]
MSIDTLRKIFERDLGKLKKEIELYQDETKLWVVEKNIANSGGNLCLHLVGNLNAFVGAGLGNTGYVRDRVGEFANKNVPKSNLLNMVEETAQVVDKTLEKIKDGDLDEMYPAEVFKEPMTTGFFLLHLCAHLSYHLGQVNYHRRLLDTND